MNTKYFDLINQTYYFPQEEFTLNKDSALLFHNIDLMKLVEQYGTPLKFTYLVPIRLVLSMTNCEIDVNNIFAVISDLFEKKNQNFIRNYFKKILYNNFKS